MVRRDIFSQGYRQDEKEGMEWEREQEDGPLGWITFVHEWERQNIIQWALKHMSSVTWKYRINSNDSRPLWFQMTMNLDTAVTGVFGFVCVICLETKHPWKTIVFFWQR